MATPTRLMTVDEFDVFTNANSEQLYELVHGRAVEKVTNEDHGELIILLGHQLMLWKQTNGVACVISTNVHHVVDERNARLPDLSVRFTDERASKRPLRQAPPVAVEIKSRSNTMDKLREKAAFFIAHGTRLVWIIAPNQPSVEIHAPDAAIRTLSREDTLDGGDVLPGFSLKLRDLFT